jgi:hypothetical protein
MPRLSEQKRGMHNIESGAIGDTQTTRRHRVIIAGCDSGGLFAASQA